MLAKDTNSWCLHEGGGKAINCTVFSSPLVYMSWQHVTIGDLMSRKGLSDQTAGCFTPTDIRPLFMSVAMFCCFPFLSNTWESCKGLRAGGERETLPTFQHIPAPNAWAQPHIVGILAFKGAAVLCFSQHITFKCWVFFTQSKKRAFPIISVWFFHMEYSSVCSLTQSVRGIRIMLESPCCLFHTRHLLFFCSCLIAVNCELIGFQFNV